MKLFINHEIVVLMHFLFATIIDVKELFPENFNVNIPLGGLMGD